ncbi:hypothetical protein GALMADRAFT_138587 [Galerina marginata CBS 339.88]|uniref:Uncharacterized protein n=1 Tax=Galerina marginata (strain CBS 339.88) TaxID=685588 RepID=A0A067T2Z6_GALM3|nr:hypothetical protein GALMADRAFT_138587 [Galerina marginata CBS 339.88]
MTHNRSNVRNEDAQKRLPILGEDIDKCRSLCVFLKTPHEKIAVLRQIIIVVNISGPAFAFDRLTASKERIGHYYFVETELAIDDLLAIFVGAVSGDLKTAENHGKPGNLLDILLMFKAINPKGLVSAVILREFLEDTFPSHKPNLLPLDPADRALAQMSPKNNKEKRDSVVNTTSLCEHLIEIYGRYLCVEAQSEAVKAIRAGRVIPKIKTDRAGVDV